LRGEGILRREGKMAALPARVWWRRHGHSHPALLPPPPPSPASLPPISRHRLPLHLLHLPPRPRPGSSTGGSEEPSLPSSAREPSSRVLAHFPSPWSPPAASLATQSPSPSRPPAGLRVPLPRDSPDTSPLLLSSGRLWLPACPWFLRAGVAADKSQKREWPFAEVSRCASCPVVKQAWRVVLWRRGACIPCALSRRPLCVAATTTSSSSSTGTLTCAPSPRLPLPSPPPPPRSPHCCHGNRYMLCCSHMPSAHGPHRLWTAASCAQLWAAGVACNKWQIQKWPFATVSAAVARCVVSLCHVVFVRNL
jgi:hypothetical protein